MSKIHGMMDIGKRSMMNSQTAMQTTGHNIANRSTEGYSRQRVDIQSNEAIGHGKLRMGMGSKAASVSRINNPYLEKQIGKERSVLGYHQGMNDPLTRVEQVFNEQMNKGLNNFVSEFFNSFREFSNNPENLASRTQLRESADYLAKDFKRINNQLKEIQNDIDGQLNTQVHEINETTLEIASLNEKIKLVTMQGGPANDERDRRDVLVKKLGERINIRWGEGDDGMVTITAGNSALLVAGVEAKRLAVAATPETDTKNEGNFDVFYMNNDKAVPIKVTEQINGGSVGGLLEVRDKSINKLLSNLDQMAYTIASSINEIHTQGFDAYNQKAGQFFVLPTQLRHTSEKIVLSKAIFDDPGRIAAAADMNAPGDNRIANRISQLQYQGLLNDGAATLDDYYNSMVGQVGIQARRTKTAHQAQNDIVRQLGNIRESVSGVSLDEETTKLIEFQKAFDASARLIRTADEMFDTVLNLKRM